MTANVAKCLLVAKVLVADGMMTDEERAFLDAIVRQLGLTDDEKRRVTELEGMAEAEAVARALPIHEKQALLDVLVDAAGSDGRLAALELGAVKRLAATLGLDRAP
jgi:uncharacterized tellurite resistance protein B-like protein